MGASLTDPPRGWEAMLGELALDASEVETPPAADAPPEPEPSGFLDRVAGFVRRVSPSARAVAAGDDYLRPLGLQTMETPERVYNSGTGRGFIEGETVVEGKRRGREVRIELAAGRYTTTLSGAVADFHVRSEDGRLIGSERSPDAVRGAVAALSPDERWRGVEVKGGAEGVTVFHRAKGKAASQGLWFDDLWLAERLAEIAGDGPAAHA
jgi:hypothetical protein